MRKCDAYQEAHKNVLARATGRYLATAVREWMDGRTALATARVTARELKVRYQNALKAYEAAAAVLEKGETKDVRDRFDKTVAGLKDASSALETVGGFLGVKALSEDRLQDLDAIIGALNGKDLDPDKYDASLRQSIGALTTLPGFADRAIELARRRQAPPLGPLILEKMLHQARAAASDRQVRRAEEQVQWLERRMTAQRDRAIRLLEARSRLERAVRHLAAGAPCDGDQTCARGRLQNTAVEAFSDAVPAASRILLWQSMAEYADSFSIDATAAAEADYRLVALEYETALDRSEDAVREWQALIAVPIDRLIAYHGSGIRPAEVAALIAHFLIAVGVNR